MRIEPSRTRTEVNLRKIASKYSAIASFTFAVLVVLIEQATYPVGNGFGMDLAYAAFPFLIFSAVFMAYEYSYTLVKQIWQEKRLKTISIAFGVGYGIFYIFSTNIVAPPDIPVSPDAHSYAVAYTVYGLLTNWPDLEFYSSPLNLAGYFSIGNVLLVASLAGLTAVATALLLHSIHSRLASNRINQFPMIGAIFTALSTNGCCCCTPVILPAAFALFGLASSNPIAEEATYQTMPIFNLLWIATLLFLLLSILFSVRRTNACNE